MTTEIIREIKETERAGEEKVKAAYQEAKDLIARTEEEAARIIKAAEDQEFQNSRHQLEKAEKEAYLEADTKRKENNEKCQELQRKAAEKMEDAVNLVMERIVRINVNS